MASHGFEEKEVSANLVEVFHNETNGITTLSLARAPVNSLNLDLLIEIQKALKNAVDNGSKGIILTSSLSTVFCAGLDINEMIKPDLDRCNRFWRSLQDMWLTLYGLGIPTAAAINGSSPGGGCALALCCEYRVMVESAGGIGFTGTRLGVVIPSWMQDALIKTVGYRQAELSLLRGKMLKAAEALRIGLVDELADNKDVALSKCEAYISEFAIIPSEVRAETKASIRKEALNWLRNNRELDRKIFVDALLRPQVQENLEKYIQALKNKSK